MRDNIGAKSGFRF